MKTYKIQQKVNDNWINLVNELKHDIELISIHDARTIAITYATHEMYDNRALHWRIVDSEGNYHAV